MIEKKVLWMFALVLKYRCVFFKLTSKGKGLQKCLLLQTHAVDVIDKQILKEMLSLQMIVLIGFVDDQISDW